MGGDTHSYHDKVNNSIYVPVNYPGKYTHIAVIDPHVEIPPEKISVDEKTPLKERMNVSICGTVLTKDIDPLHLLKV